MRLKAPQLANHLKQKGLAPVYLLTGDEPLQEMECADLIRAAAREQGYSERTVISPEGRKFDWKDLRAEAGSLSLFASRRLLELRLEAKLPPDNDGPNFSNSKVWHEYLAAPPPDTLLLVTAARADSKTQKTKWFQALDKVGIILQLSAPAPAQMPDWIRQRLAAHGLHAADQAVALLAERAEGHLLAAAQEVEKLRLLYPEGDIGAAQVLDAVADNARFEVFAWLDTVLNGDVARLVRQLRGLRGGGVEVVVIATLLEREVRNLCRIAHALQAGQSMAQVMQQFKVWSNRKGLVQQAVKRHSPRAWLQLLAQAGTVERMIKGMATGNPWDEVLSLALRVAGVKLGGR